MAKPEKKILSAVRLNGEVYTADRADELAAVLNKDQTKDLTERGAISGFGTEPVEDADAPTGTGKGGKAK